MRERPILLNAEMVRAVLDGSKTQTRRIIQSPAKNMQAHGHECISYRAPGDKWYQDYVFSMRDRSGTWQDYKHDQFLAKCPFGAVGDRLWVRETFAPGLCTATTIAYRETHKPEDLEEGWYERIKWTPSIHMPRWASRITLEITGVRVERLASISNHDAVREGCPAERALCGGSIDAWLWFRDLWDNIYPEQSFKHNPWVWVIEFKRVDECADKAG